MEISEDALNTIRTVAPPSASVYRLSGNVLAIEYLAQDLYSLVEMSRDEFEAVTAGDAMKMVLPEDKSLVCADIEACLHTGQTQDCYFRILHKTRGLDWVHAKARYFGEKQGQPLLFVTFANASMESDIYRKLLNRLQHAVYVCDCDTYEILYTNAAARKYSGVDENYLGKKCYSYIQDRSSPCGDCFLKDIKPGEFLRRRRYNRNRDAWEQLSGEYINWCGHNAFVQYIEDITEDVERQSEIDRLNGELKKRIDDHNHLMDISDVCIVKISLQDFSFIEYNDVMCRMLGYSREEYERLYKHRMGLLFTGDYKCELEKLQKTVSEALKSGVKGFSIRMRVPDRHGRVVPIGGTAVFGELDPASNRPSCLFAVYRDITDIIEAQRKLTDAQLEAEKNALVRAHMEKMQRMVNSMPCGLAAVRVTEGEAENHTIQLNRYFLDHIGIRRRDGGCMTTWEFLSCLHPDDRERCERKFREFLAQKVGSIAADTYRMINTHGDYFWVRVRGELCPNPDGGAIAYFVYINVDDLKKTHARLEESQRQYRMAVRSAELSMFEYDIPNHRITMSDDETTQKSCAKHNIPQVIENVPESLGRFVDEESMPALLEIYKKVEDGKDASCDVWYKKTPTMPRHCLRLSYTVTKDETGKAVVAHAITQDITIMKQEEEKYARAYKQLNEAHPASLASFHLNLTKNWCGEGISSLPFVLKQQESGTVDGYFKEFSKLIADDRVKEEFFRTFNREKLLKEYLDGKTKVSIKYPIVYPDGIRHMRDGQLYMLQNPRTDDIEAYTYAIDIDEEMDFENMVKAVSSGACGFIIVLDITNGRIRFGGDTAEGASENYRNEDYTAPMVKALVDMMPTDKLDEAIRAHSVENIRRELEDKSLYQITLETKDGRYFHWRIFYIDKERTLVMIMRSDITDVVAKERRQEQQLQAALDIAEKANEAKSAFLSSMSHDLRTPLCGVLGFTEFALKEKDQLKKQSYLEKIDSSGKLLLDLVNDTLELSRIESGKMTLNQDTVMSDELAEAVITSLRPVAELKGVRLVSNFSDLPNVPVWCDKLKVNKIILNLISNSIKYTPAGGTVTVSLKPLPTEMANCTECLIIEDTGIGMSEEFMKHMYEPFSQEKRSESANVLGTGLGLAIVKRYVDLMGGSISATSVLHKGTRWVVSLPIHKNSDSIARKKEDEEAVGSLSGLRVLLCEDNQMNLEIATMLLQDKGILTDTAENGQIGLDKFRASETGFYDAVLTDIRMPQMDGCEMSRRIRALDRSDANTVPIIAMTADAFEESIREAKAAGINDYVTKPIVPGLLYKALVNAAKSD